MTERVTEPTKICFCVDGWPTFFPMHGPARYVQTLARGLVARGCEVHIVTGHPTIERDFVEEGYHVHARKTPSAPIISRWQPGIGESFLLWRAIEALHRKHRFDLVEFTNVEGVGLFTAALSRWHLPTVIRAHTTAFDAFRLGIGRAKLEAGYARLERLTAKCATAVVTHTKTHQAQVAEDYRIPADTIYLVPHGLVPAKPDREVTRLPNQIVSVGSATVRKGVSLFLDAAARLIGEFPDLRFVWAGKDGPSAPGKRTWTQYAKEQYPALDGKVEFRQSLSDEAIASLYAESTLYLCTARYESFGLTLVEASFAGLPVVAPRTAAMAEIIRDGQTGWLYEAGSLDDLVARVRAALASPSVREAAGAEARRVAEAEYTASVMTSRMLDVYRAVGQRGQRTGERRA